MCGVFICFALALEINKQFEESRHKTVSYRKLRDINIDNFKRDIKNSVHLNSTDGDVDDLTTNYIDGLKILVDAHAPHFLDITSALGLQYVSINLSNLSNTENSSSKAECSLVHRRCQKSKTSTAQT